MSTLEQRLARLEVATFTPEQLTAWEAEDEAEATAAWRAAIWPMLTPAEKLKVEKAQPGEAVEVAR